MAAETDATLVNWLLGGGATAALGAAIKLYMDNRAMKREEQSDVQKHEQTIWTRLDELADDVRKERDQYRERLIDSEARRISDGEACEKRIIAVRDEGRRENDELRTQIRDLSKLCHSQQLAIDAHSNEVSDLKRRLYSAQPIVGGRRASDPTLSEGVTIPVPQPTTDHL